MCLSDERALQNRLSERYEGKISDMWTFFEFSGMLFAWKRDSYPRIFGATQESNLQRRGKNRSKSQPNRPTPSLFLSFLMSASSAAVPLFTAQQKPSRGDGRILADTKEFACSPKIVGKKYDFWRKLLWLKKRN